MIAKIINWVSRIFRLVVITRTAFDALSRDLEILQKTVGDLRYTIDSYREAVRELRDEKAELNDKLLIAVDRLEIIAENDALTNGTARKLTAIAKAAIAEVTEGSK